MAPPDLSAILEQISALEAKVTTASEQKTESAAKGGVSAIWGWLLGLVAAAAIAIGAFFLLHNLKKKNEELAKLRTQVEQDKVRQANVAHEATLAPHEERAEELRTEAETLKERIRAQEYRIATTQGMHDLSMERVLQAKTWEELEKLNDENR